MMLVIFGKAMPMQAQDVIDRVIAAYGGVHATQVRFAYTQPMGVYNWRSRGIPRHLIADIHLDTGIDIAELKTATGNQDRAA